MTNEHLTIDDEQYVCIPNVDRMDPFLMSVVSNADLWMFVGSNTGITAGRRDPDVALFPYQTADKILKQAHTAGPLGIFWVEKAGPRTLWEPWQPGTVAAEITRNLYKHVTGSSVIFEEIHRGLGLRVRWKLASSARFGLVWQSTLENIGADTVSISSLNGWQSLMPPGVNQEVFARYSYLASAYMRHELVAAEGLGIYTLNSGITDRAEPCESLRVSVAWAVGPQPAAVLLSDNQVAAFRRGEEVRTENEIRGEFGAYLVAGKTELAAGQARTWWTVADIGLDHRGAVQLRNQLREPAALQAALSADVDHTAGKLRGRIAAADGLQQTADRAASVHHFANVLFNCMRGGTFNDGYAFLSSDLAAFLRSRSVPIYTKHRAWLDGLPERFKLEELPAAAAKQGDPQLSRLTREYLPLSFSRRHGDPSRPWNRFVIQTEDSEGNPLYGYQGNWRDIFQNWESLAQSYPVALGSMIAVFLNASTADGYNPYRITRDGIDWEVHDPNDPWSHIGYWGDHQIIYLLRLLESHVRFWPGQLVAGLNQRDYAYALVPYEIGPFSAIEHDPSETITFNKERHQALLAKAAEIGGDGKLIADAPGSVLLVSLAEKLLVPALVKLSNLVPGGGIWLNTQRPEWNDANNALAGWGLSMVTVCYLRRYLAFLDGLLAQSSAASIELSGAVAAFLTQLVPGLQSAAAKLDDAARYRVTAELGKAGEIHRAAVYRQEFGAKTAVAVASVRDFIRVATEALDATLRANRRDDALYHSYNVLHLRQQHARVEYHPVMLEGQVAVLSSGFLSEEETLALLHGLRASALYREDQRSYVLYPNRQVAPFLSRNTLPDGWRTKAPVLAELADAKNRSIIVLDEDGAAHFQADFTNAAGLKRKLDALAKDTRWSAAVQRDREAILELWETVFTHSTFTGRSGTMFAFEGLGSIYWHMIAKLLLAVQENYQHAADAKADAARLRTLAAAYEQVRHGLGFTKTPQVYGAFPTDPYSHTPAHRGAQQPGMTGQVKEEILTRMGELGIEVTGGQVSFAPRLLHADEFFAQPHAFEYLDLSGAEKTWKLPADSLAFTFCQVPVAYVLGGQASIAIQRGQTSETISGNKLSLSDSQRLYNRTGEITSLTVSLVRSDLPFIPRT